ncbi:MAG: hypothetical protein ACYCSN_15500 [Acidobacteriaceae bacterium]
MAHAIRKSQALELRRAIRYFGAANVAQYLEVDVARVQRWAAGRGRIANAFQDRRILFLYQAFHFRNGKLNRSAQDFARFVAKLNPDKRDVVDNFVRYLLYERRLSRISESPQGYTLDDSFSGEMYILITRKHGILQDLGIDDGEPESYVHYWET